MATDPHPFRCAFGTLWLDHFDPPIGTGLGCLACDAYAGVTSPVTPASHPRGRARKASAASREPASPAPTDWTAWFR